MKLKVVGTGAIWTKYNSACYLIDNHIMIDFPNGAIKYLYRQNILPQDIDSILITHFHGDHFLDVPFFIETFLPKNKNIVNIYCHNSGKGKIEKLGMISFSNSFKYYYKNANVNYNFKEHFKIENYDIKKIEVSHGKLKPCYGYVFSFNNSAVGFTGDSSYCDAIDKMAKMCNYLVCDCTLLNGNEKHMGVNNLRKLANNYPKCRFIASHMLDGTREELKKLKIENVIIPSDGDEFDIK